MLLFNWACCVTVGLIAEIPVSITAYNDFFHDKSYFRSVATNVISIFLDIGYCR
jgi:hypothetical protein